MRRLSFLISFLGVISLLVACSPSQESALIQPTKGKLTFAFFFTDGWQPWANMQPIVDGLENNFQESVEFIHINASTTEGLEIFRTYSLLGHPSYLILDKTGEILWQSVGEQEVDILESALDAALKK